MRAIEERHNSKLVCECMWMRDIPCRKCTVHCIASCLSKTFWKGTEVTLKTSVVMHQFGCPCAHHVTFSRVLVNFDSRGVLVKLQCQRCSSGLARQLQDAGMKL